MTIVNIKKPKRRTPTQNQIEKLMQLNSTELLLRAAESLSCLNRRAKEKRDRLRAFRGCSFAYSIESEIAEIYSLKTRFLDVTVQAGLAKVSCWEVQPAWGQCSCPKCGKTWHGGPGQKCRKCGTEGILTPFPAETWYMVECCGYRFHQPPRTATDAIRLAAVPTTESHDPYQEAREIPDVGLTIEAQFACVELAIERIERTNCDQVSASS